MQIQFKKNRLIQNESDELINILNHLVKNVLSEKTAKIGDRRSLRSDESQSVLSHNERPKPAEGAEVRRPPDRAVKMPGEMDRKASHGGKD